ncbi:MAG: SDR family NAD(P)-dependent oxidoreductase [Flavobacteriales bacterium]|nr:SDR family NAD(P)-dependent oxidoreductase [Flavobacteriales bacterium]
MGTMRSIAKKKDLVQQLQQAGVRLVEMDVTDDASVDRAVAEAIAKMGGLDVVFNNAGIGATGIQELFTAADLQRVFDVNVFGTQRLMRAVLPHMRAREGHHPAHVELHRSNDHTVLRGLLRVEVCPGIAGGRVSVRVGRLRHRIVHHRARRHAHRVP